jgi:hypothetical protein
MSYDLPDLVATVESEYRPKGLDRRESQVDLGCHKVDLFVAPSIVDLGVAVVRCDHVELQPI